MNIFIDNQLCQIDAQTECPTICYDSADWSSLDKLRKGHCYRFSIPINHCNRQIMGDSDRIHTASSFNDQDHNARVEFDGAPLIEGPVVLIASQVAPESGRYLIEVQSGVCGWAREAMRNHLKNVNLEFESEYSSSAIINSWTGDKLVRMLPVLRDKYSDAASTTELLPIQRIPGVTDYHPFISVPKLLEAIFAEAGYSIESRLLTQSPAKDLVMSGRFSWRDTTRLDARMGFRAGRDTASTAVADSYGMVYADPFTTFNTVGNLVNTVVATEVAPDLYSSDTSFRVEEGEAIFSPPERVKMIMYLKFHYMTDYRIATRDRLQGFNTIMIDQTNKYSFALANRFVDHRPSFHSGMEYRIVVFNHTEGTSYRLEYTAKTANTLTRAVATTFTADNALFTINSSITASEPTLYYKGANSSVWRICPNDWALYPGYVEMTGQTEVEVTIATAPREVSSAEPFLFRNIAFAGALPGQSMTLYASTRAYPSFQPHPALGSIFTLQDIMKHDVLQSKLIESIAHMYDLRFYTDPIERKVYIESDSQMVDPSRVVDWSDRIIESLPIEISDASEDGAREICYRYQIGDGAVGRYDQQNEDFYGQWSGQVDSRLARKSDHTSWNPMFAPTINASNLFALAPSVSLPQVGDRDADQDGELNFPTKILLYLGVRELPDEERWGLASSRYPLSAFHLDGECSLCFEDRDDQTGLHSYYDARYKRMNEARRVTLWLDLSATDILPIIETDADGMDMRAAYHLTIGGEQGLYRLEAVEEFLPEKNQARCRFVQIV